MENDLFRVGVIANTHGIRGEVKVYPTTDDLNRFDRLKEVILDTGRERINLQVQGVRYFKNMAILKFKGIDNINDVEKYKGKDLLVTRENAVPLEENEYYIADLIDMEVYNEDGSRLGILNDVMQTGANDVYVINGINREYLIPAIPEVVISTDIDGNIMTIRPLEGLFE